MHHPFFDLAARGLRLLPAELAHNLSIWALSVMPQIRVPPIDPRLACRLAGLDLPSPIGMAAGYDKDAHVPHKLRSLGFGFVECGTVTPKPQPGNPKPRLFRLNEDKAIINRFGFNSCGSATFCRKLARFSTYQGIIGANIGANKDSVDRIADYCQLLPMLWPYSDYITINISSPNTKGLRDFQSRSALQDMLGQIGEVVELLQKGGGDRPIFLKIAPDLDETDIGDIVQTVLGIPWIKALIVSNTTLARPDHLKSSHRTQIGGLSGRPLHEKSTRILQLVAEACMGRLELVGVGGISTAQDVIEKFQAGANAVQLYSALIFEGPSIVQRIHRDLIDRMERDGINHIRDYMKLPNEKP